MFKIRIVRDPREFASLEPVWNRLLASSDMDIPFMTFEWFRMYWEFFEKHSEMLVCVLSQDKEPVAIVPLMRIPAFWRGVPHSAVTFIANYFSCRTGLINPSGQKVLEHVLDRLRCEGIKYDIFYANFIPEDSVTDKEVREYLASTGLPHRTLDWNHSPYIALPAAWEDYLASRDQRFRYNLRRTLKLFEKDADYAVRVYDRREQFDEAWQKLLTVSRHTWKFRQGTAIANKNISNIFIVIARMAFARGWMKIRILEHKSVPIAFTYELHYNKKLYFSKIGFDEDYTSHGPGIYMHCKAIQDAIAGGYTEFDFLGKNEEHKMRFTPLVHTHHKYIVFNKNPLGRLLSGYEFSLIPSTRQAVRRLRRRVTRPEEDSTRPQPQALYDRQAAEPVSAPSPLSHALRVLYMALIGYPQR